MRQDFTTPATLGGFDTAYRDWATYDGGQDTSHNTSRPAKQVGVYNSATTTTVHDSLFDGRFFTDRNGTPNVFAITPPNQDQGGGQTYGRYSVRFKIDAAAGYKIAWLLWPTDDRWSEGEIDFPEGDLDGQMSGYSHDVTGNPEHNAFAFDSGVPASGAWHTATIEWTPGKISYTLDGRSRSTTSAAAMPSHPMRWALQTETAVSSTAPNPATTGHVYVDWLTSYKYTP
jgi:hypothetical protein